MYEYECWGGGMSLYVRIVAGVLIVSAFRIHGKIEFMYVAVDL